MLLPYRSRRLGPALKGEPLPMVAISLSAVVHIMALALLTILAGVWNQWNQSKVYVVNLVPAISAVGSWSGPTPASPRPQSPSIDKPVAKSPSASAPKEKPAPETKVKPATPKELPPPIAQAEPARMTKEPQAPVTKIKPAMPNELLPPIAQAEPARMTKEPPALPKSPESPSSPLRFAGRLGALPSPGAKELAPLVSSREPQPVTTPLPPRAEAAPTLPRVEPVPPPEPRPVVTGARLGSPSGSPAGTASLALDVSDFPFTWYLQQIVRKVSEKWVPPAQAAEPGQRTLVLFEIGREGQITTPKIERSSGNAYYDQAALRAVMDASPFPPLPKEFTARILRVHLGFEPPTGRG